MGDAARILLVDDEVAVSRLLATYLQRLGYEVETCASGEDGLARFEAQPDGFDVVLADLTLPGISGADMLRKMLELRPAQRAIVSSGYPFAVETLPASVPNQIGFLQKPYLPNMLADEIARSIKRSKAASKG